MIKSQCMCVSAPLSTQVDRSNWCSSATTASMFYVLLCRSKVLTWNARGRDNIFLINPNIISSLPVKKTLNIKIYFFVCFRTHNSCHFYLVFWSSGVYWVDRSGRSDEGVREGANQWLSTSTVLIRHCLCKIDSSYSTQWTSLLIGSNYMLQ